MPMLRQLDQLCREHLSIGLASSLGLIAFLSLAGALAGLLFPKWTAEGLLETPGVLTPGSDREIPKPIDQDSRLKTQYVTLAEFRKMAAAYSSRAALIEFLTAAGKADSAAGQRLAAQAESGRFWSGVAQPVLPFNRRDAREFGELKDVASDSLVGIELRTDARTPDLAQGMLGLMSSYYTNSLIRERIRAWMLKNSGEAPARQKALRAEIVEAQMKIDATAIRIQEFKKITARYPDAAKLDARQVISITEGSDRFLSPLAQLVAAETSIAQLHETIARKQRQAHQWELIERYFVQANKKFEETLTTSNLVPALSALTTQPFEGVDKDADWAREVLFRLEAEIAAFSSALASFGVRNEYRLDEVASRDPRRLAVFGAGAGILLLGLMAFIRAALRVRAEAVGPAA